MSKNNLSLKHSFVLTGFLSFFLIVILIPVFYDVQKTGIIWDIANALGYVAVGCLLLLFALSGRRNESFLFGKQFSARFHRDVSFGFLFLTILHIVLLIIKEPLLIEHLKLSAPWYMLSGLMAFILVFFLVVSSLVQFRSRLWPNYFRFQRVHKWTSIIIAVLVGVHVFGSGFYLNMIIKDIFFLLIISGVIVVFLRTDTKRERGNKATLNNYNYKYYSAWISLSIVLVLSIVCILLILFKYESFINVTL